MECQAVSAGAPAGTTVREPLYKGIEQGSTHAQAAQHGLLRYYEPAGAHELMTFSLLKPFMFPLVAPSATVRLALPTDWCFPSTLPTNTSAPCMTTWKRALHGTLM